MWAARPHLGSIFEKLLHRKTFILPAAHILQPIAIRSSSPLTQNTSSMNKL
jgi:hypothetical protein